VLKLRIRMEGAKAVSAVSQIIANEHHPHRLRGALAVIQRIDPEITRIDQNVKVEVVDQTQLALDYLKHLIEKGATEEFLLNEFGPGGLERYRKLLAARETEKIIDAEFKEVSDE
jgi:hypothetical protein